jgi:Reverse transcriptase (RNA-dependent DNA polymerase)/gag-polypeptide of LTR copia-type/Integrase core domain/GAG-pre-integrase domain/Domain of unknown function (DUF4219)/Zinc knuckle
MSDSMNLSTIPQLDGENYNFWCIKMKTILKSHGLWEAVDPGVTGTDSESVKKDSRAMCIIQQGVSDVVFPKIAGAQNAKEAWTNLSTSYEGNTRVKTMKLQGLRRDFETLLMKPEESVQLFLTRVQNIVNQIKVLGGTITDEAVVSKILRSLKPDFDHVVAAIEESKDLTTYTLAELSGSLQTHETRLRRREEVVGEQAFYVRGNGMRGRGRRGRGMSSRGGRGKADSSSQGGKTTDSSDQDSSEDYKKTVKCYNCNKLGHYQYECKEASKKVVRCYHCNKLGHTQSQCYTRKREEEQVSYAQEGEGEQEEEEDVLFMAHTSHEIDPTTIWFLDSGCSNHMTGYKDQFITLDNSFKSSVKLGDSKTIQVEGRGTVSVMTAGGVRYLQNVYFIPRLSQNLLSIGQLTSNGYEVNFNGKVCTIKDESSDQLIASVEMAENKLFPLEMTTVKDQVFIAKEVKVTDLWHQRFGHLNGASLKLLKDKELVHGMPEMNEIGLCEGCIYGKQTRKAFPKHQGRRSEEILELIHSDLVGPMRTTSLGGSKYFLLFTDDFSRRSWVYFLENKSDTFNRFKKFKALMETQTGKKIKVLRSDNGGEYVSKEFNDFCDKEGVHHELTVPYTPQQNGVAERKNRTVLEMSRSLLKHAKLPNNFWAEAVGTAVYLLNRAPTKSLDGETPMSIWAGKRPDVSHFKVFGCVAYGFVHEQKRDKLGDKATKEIFIGYSERTKGYRLYNPVTKKVTVNRCVVFDENCFWNWQANEGIQTETEQRTALNCDDVIGDWESNDDSEEQEVTETPLRTYVRRNSAARDAARGRDVRETNRKVRRLSDLYEATTAMLVADPTCFEEATGKEVWSRAMSEEIAAIERNKTWNLVKLPEGKNAIGVKWLYKTKVGSDGEIVKHKARLVVRGFTQEKGVDYDETFAPVARFETIRTLIALAAKLNLIVYQFDVKSAFLNGELREDVYIEQPRGFEVKGKEEMVYKLDKALYGLKQAPRAWYSKIDAYFREHKFERSSSEPNLYVKKSENSEFLIVCLYVDDMIYMGSNQELVEKFKESMKRRFEMTDLGELKYFLGLEVIQGDEGIFVSQRKYAMDLVNRFNLKGCNGVNTPMNAKEKLVKKDGSPLADGVVYRSLVGGLIYLTHTRPDISFSVGVVSRFMHDPSKHHLGAAKRILKYIAGTAEYGLWYAKENGDELVGYSDSDWAGCYEDMKSTSGYIFFLGSSPISWRSKKQPTVALSSSEAEYVAMCSAACQAVWLRRVLEDVGNMQEGAVVLKCDNKSTIAMCKNPVLHGRSKHIDIKLHFIRELVASRSIEVDYVPTADQKADILTKALQATEFLMMRRKLGVIKYESRGGVDK